jgi:phage terminase large subunit-like protein
LDDKDRTEKILGNEYATIYLNECSQIKSNSTREMIVTRLAQVCYQTVEGVESPLQLKMYYDCNPPSKLHWSYVLFVKKQEPENKAPLKNPDDYAIIQMNPQDNKDNLNAQYLESLQNLSSRMKKRFYDGGFSDAMQNQLFPDTVIDSYRILDGTLPDMVRVIVAVDPSGAGDEDNAHNDAIGIVCGGLGTDGKAYIFEDNTVKAGPKTWGTVAVNTYETRRADLIVGEKNYGGEMVRFVIQTCKPDVPFKFVTATRGKVVRAEPFSALYEQGKVVHVGHFPELEDELQGFSTNGFIGDKSPNRADALIWLLSELFSGMVAGPKSKSLDMQANGFGW